jgi:hypothetical protein
MQMMATLVFGLLAAAPAAPAGVHADATATLGETVRLGRVTVRPIAVVEDSRCPRDVLCVHAGRLLLRARISGVRRDAVLTLHQPYRLPGGSTLTLVSVAPDRWQSAPPPGSDATWRFGFRQARR